MNSKPLLQLNSVTKVFSIGGGLGVVSGRKIKAVNNVSFTIAAQKPVIQALVGESGSGKTTIARMILGLTNPTSGQILYDGQDICNLLKKDRKYYRREVQPIFQDPYNAYNPLYHVDRVLNILVKKFKLAEKQERKKIIEESLKEIGLRPNDVLGRYPHQLSGGERQRLMLARILLLKPKLIIADEPVSMVDVSLRAMFLDNLIEYKEKLNISSLFITHDLNVAHYVSDKIMVLARGEIVESGDTDLVVRKPLHPYTKELIESIPVPDPDNRWKKKVEVKETYFREVTDENQCINYNKCSFAMDMCKKEKPPMIKMENGQEVACFLYREKK